MALFRRVILADGLGRHFRQSCGIPILFGVSFIHGKLQLETASLVKNTPLPVPFSTSPEKAPDLWIGIDKSSPFLQKPAEASWFARPGHQHDPSWTKCVRSRICKGLAGIRTGPLPRFALWRDRRGFARASARMVADMHENGPAGRAEICNDRRLEERARIRNGVGEMMRPGRSLRSRASRAVVKAVGAPGPRRL